MAGSEEWTGRARDGPSGDTGVLLVEVVGVPLVLGRAVARPAVGVEEWTDGRHVRRQVGPRTRVDRTTAGAGEGEGVGVTAGAVALLRGRVETTT